MVDFLQLAEQMVPKLVPRRTVRYQRGVLWVEFEVTVGRSIVNWHDDYGMRHRAEQRDYIFEAALLILGGSVVEPADGDEIVDTAEGATRTYVVASAAGEVGWRYTDRYHTMLRVHVKEIDEA